MQRVVVPLHKKRHKCLKCRNGEYPCPPPLGDTSVETWRPLKEAWGRHTLTVLKEKKETHSLKKKNKN